jgi:hypothetical protein
MALQNRHIVLREFTPLLDREITPSVEYLATTDGSLAADSFRLRIDADGFMETGNESRGATPIYILGDSFSEAVFEHENLRFFSILERHLLSKGFDIRILNASFSRATSLHMFNLFINKVLSSSVRPGTKLLFFQPQIDVQITDAPGNYWNTFGLYSPINPSQQQTDDLVHIHKHDIHSTSRLLNSVVDVCKRFEIEVILGTAPARRTDRANDPVLQQYFADPAQWTERMAIRDALNNQVREVARDRNLLLADADSYFAARSGGLYDFTHMNTEGQRMLADLLTGLLSS